MKRKKILNLVVRVGISILFLCFLFSKTNIIQLFKTLSKTDSRIWILCIVLYLLGQFVSAYKWKLLSGWAGFKGKISEYFDYYLVGMFFNLFLPTTVGGDVAKCYYLYKRNPKSRKAPAVYSVLAERFTGVVVIVWACTIAMFTPIGDPVSLHIKLFMVLLSLSILITTPIFPPFCRKFLGRNKWVKSLLDDVEIYWQSPALIMKALFWSLIFHCIVIIIHIAIGIAIGINIPWCYYLIVYPMTSIAGFIPFSFNGLGPREATYIYFLSLIGIKSYEALAFSIFWFGIVVLSSLIGGIFYIKGKRVSPNEINMDETKQGESVEVDELVEPT